MFCFIFSPYKIFKIKIYNKNIISSVFSSHLQEPLLYHLFRDHFKGIVCEVMGFLLSNCRNVLVKKNCKK